MNRKRQIILQKTVRQQLDQYKGSIKFIETKITQVIKFLTKHIPVVSAITFQDNSLNLIVNKNQITGFKIQIIIQQKEYNNYIGKQKTKSFFLMLKKLATKIIEVKQQNNQIKILLFFLKK